jgi:hypothetical protein
MADTHELRLKIDAAPAQAGAKQFTSAIQAVKKAVSDLDRDTAGAFTKLKNISPKVDVSGLRKAASEANALTSATTKAESASTRAAANIQRTALSAAAALRTSEGEAQRLAARLGSLGDTASVDRLNADLARLKANLMAAQTPLDVRGARSSFADTSAELRRNAAALSENASAEIAATRAADLHAASLEGLRSKYNPLFAASKQYEAALSEIQNAEREGILTSQLAAKARESAALGLQNAGAQALAFGEKAKIGGASVANLGYQMNDIGVMLAAGQSPLMLAVQQGTQVSQVLNGLGGGKQALSALASGFMSIISPISLITVGAIAAGAAIFYWLTGSSEETKSFTDALGDANSAISTMRSATETLAGSTLGSLADGYGRVNVELQAHLEKLKEIALIDATSATRAALDSVGGDVLGGWITTDIDDMRIAFSTTNDEARTLLGMLDSIKAAKTFEEQFAAVQKMRKEVESVTGGLGSATGGAEAFLIQLLRAEDSALRLKAAQDGSTVATHNASGAASSLAYTVGTAADEAARLLANLGSVPGALAAVGKSVAGQIAAIQSQNRALTLELSSGLSSAAANRRVQLEDVVKAGSTRGQKLNFDQIAKEYSQINALDAASKEQDKLRASIAEKNKPAKAAGGKGGSGRKEALTEEQKATEDLTKSLKDRLTSLTAERLELGLVFSGQFKTAEGAKLMAQAMAEGGGAVDKQTEAMIRQIDAAAALNEQLQRVAKDPVKEWMKSVPNWIEAGQQIEMGAINSLKGAISDFIKTGKFDIESLGESILGVIADIVSDKAVAELANLFGRNEPGAKGLGGVLGNLLSSQGDSPIPAMGGADVAQGGVQAGTSISTAMIQAGQQVSSQLSAAMTQGGAQVGASAQQGLAVGSTSVRSAAQSGLTGGAMQVRVAGTTAGVAMQRGVVQGGEQAGTSMATKIGMAGAGGGAGGGGGGFLASMGGVGGILSMALGAFSEGGMSTSPVGHASMPVSAFRHAPHFASGTTNTSGIPAVLHPNEAVIPLSKGRKIGVELNGAGAGGNGGTVQNFTWNVQTPDADSFRKSQTQIAADAARAGNNAARRNG